MTLPERFLSDVKNFPRQLGRRKNEARFWSAGKGFRSREEILFLKQQTCGSENFSRLKAEGSEAEKSEHKRTDLGAERSFAGSREKSKETLECEKTGFCGIKIDSCEKSRGRGLAT